MFLIVGARKRNSIGRFARVRLPFQKQHERQRFLRQGERMLLQIGKVSAAGSARRARLLLRFSHRPQLSTLLRKSRPRQRRPRGQSRQTKARDVLRHSTGMFLFLLVGQFFLFRYFFRIRDFPLIWRYVFKSTWRWATSAP